jgi:hypothetical protein
VRSHTARHAITDYLRSLGCRDDELEPIGEGEIAWRGARYTAVEVHGSIDPRPDEPAS